MRGLVYTLLGLGAGAGTFLALPSLALPSAETVLCASGYVEPGPEEGLYLLFLTGPAVYDADSTLVVPTFPNAVVCSEFPDPDTTQAR